MWEELKKPNYAMGGANSVLHRRLDSLDRWLLSGNIVSIIREREDRLATSQAPRDYVYTGLY